MITRALMLLVRVPLLFVALLRSLLFAFRGFMRLWPLIKKLLIMRIVAAWRNRRTARAARQEDKPKKPR